MIIVSKQQRANALEARDVMWPSIPPENVARRLEYWFCDPSTPWDVALAEVRSPPGGCGTTACFGGWCALWPAFRAQGLRNDDAGAPFMVGPGMAGENPSTMLFGDSLLFVRRGSYARSDHLFSGTDHALVTRRLDALIRNSEVRNHAA